MIRYRILSSFCLILSSLGFTKSIEIQNQIESSPNLIIYTLSAGMPLSLKGLPHIQKAAKKQKYKLIVLNDPILPVLDHENRNLYPLAERNDFFIREGIFLHFPSILLFKNGKKCGEAIPGYKDYKTYQFLIRDLEKECSRSAAKRELKNEESPLGATLVRESKTPRHIAYYYRPIDNEWVTYHNGTLTALFNRLTQEEILFQGNYDSIPTPDGKYMTLPKPLSFFSMEKIFENPSQATALPSLLTDASMQDSYQSLGVVAAGHYRAITAWSASIVMRDYVEVDGVLTESLPKKQLCKNLKISTPILSKDGLRIGAFANGADSTYTTHVYSFNIEDGLCISDLDLGERTGKVDFSFDHSRIIYTATTTDNSNLGVYARELNGPRVWRVSEMAANEALTFPSFLPNGNVLLLRVRKENDQILHVIEEYSLNEI